MCCCLLSCPFCCVGQDLLWSCLGQAMGSPLCWRTLWIVGTDICLVWELMVKIYKEKLSHLEEPLCSLWCKCRGYHPVGSCVLEMQKDYMKGPGQSIFSLLSWGGQSGSQKGPSSFYCVLPFFFFSKGSQMPEAGKINFFLMLILRWRTVMDSVAPAIRKDGTGPLTGIAAVWNSTCLVCFLSFAAI